MQSNQVIRCIIIEDEPLAAEILASHVEGTPFLQLLKICNDAISALQFLHQNTVDLIFLDIRLPKLNGIDFLKSLQQKPHVIITSAYDEFAVAGFELQVLDYLLKPIEYSRFTMAVGKLMQPIKTSEVSQDVRAFYFFNVNKRSVKIYLDTIEFIESMNDAVFIHSKDETYQTNYQMGELERMLPKADFLRIHRSFIASIPHIDSYSSTEVQLESRTLPIGRSFKQSVMARLK